MSVSGHKSANNLNIYQRVNMQEKLKISRTINRILTTEDTLKKYVSKWMNNSDSMNFKAKLKNVKTSKLVLHNLKQEQTSNMKSQNSRSNHCQKDIKFNKMYKLSLPVLLTDPDYPIPTKQPLVERQGQNVPSNQLQLQIPDYNK